MTAAARAVLAEAGIPATVWEYDRTRLHLKLSFAKAGATKEVLQEMNHRGALGWEAFKLDSIIQGQFEVVTIWYKRPDPRLSA